MIFKPIVVPTFISCFAFDFPETNDKLVITYDTSKNNGLFCIAMRHNNKELEIITTSEEHLAYKDKINHENVDIHLQ